jgi:4-amino-4-deoxy-L-arabinose transferase-like glycosyltransferase
MTGRPRHDRAMWTIAAVALLLRLAFVLLYPQRHERCEDCRLYAEVAANVADGRGFLGGFAAETFAGSSPLGSNAPEVGMGPVYPLFLAGVFRVAGRHLTPVRVAQSVLGAITVLLVFTIASRFGRRAAIAASLLTAVAPALIAYSGLLLTETMMALLLSLLVWTVIRTVSGGSFAWALAAGLSVGLAVLLRPECAVMLPIIGGVVWWRAPRRGLWLAMALTSAACATVGIWTIRNYRVFHQPIIVSAAGGETLWISTTDWTEWHFEDPALQRLVAGRDYIGQNQVLGREAIARIERDPLLYLTYCVRRIPQFWLSSHTSYVDGFGESYRAYLNRAAYGRVAVKAIFFLAHLVLLALAAAGIATAWRSVDAWIVLTPIAAIAIVHVFLYASPRYQVPLMPLLCVLAGIGIDRVIRPSRR